jgi:hypothetical protein
VVKIAVYTILAKAYDMLSQSTMLNGWFGIGILYCLNRDLGDLGMGRINEGGREDTTSG